MDFSTGQFLKLCLFSGAAQVRLEEKKKEYKFIIIPARFGADRIVELRR